MLRTVTPEAIKQTHAVIEGHIRRTPVIEVDPADFGLDCAALTFKLELLQHAGSFKARGAFANLLTRQIPAAGVVAASGGNHGVAVAFAAHKLGMRAKIFVPTVTSAAKLARLRECGADIELGGDRYDDALTASRRWVAEAGALEIHAYDQVETLLGQGTVGKEFNEQAPGIDTLLVAVGGGGLIGGIAAWYRGSVKIVAVEPEAAPTLHKALAAGRPVDAEAGGIAVDSLAPRQVGKLMFPLAQQFVDRVVLVTDEEIQAAQYRLWQTLRIAAEPGGAAAFAAVLSGRYRPRSSERLGVLVCGGNTSALSLP
jgi:threonine dehydratase